MSLKTKSNLWVYFICISTFTVVFYNRIVFQGAWNNSTDNKIISTFMGFILLMQLSLICAATARFVASRDGFEGPSFKTR